MNPAPPVTRIVSGCMVFGVAPPIILHFAAFVRWPPHLMLTDPLALKPPNNGNAASGARRECPRCAKLRVRPTTQEAESAVARQAVSGWQIEWFRAAFCRAH